MEKLVITLKSDVCIGSGFSYAGIIDNDTRFDKNGLPFIPARRIKGCLRESVKLVGCPKDIENIIFGCKGSDDSKGIIIGNAYLSYYDELTENLDDLNDKYKAYLDTQNVLRQYSCVKAQTAIADNGVAKEGSLRFIRTINHHDPITNEEMVFEAKISFEQIEHYIKDEELVKKVKEYFTKLVKATRNIGMNRNRGLGAVKLSLLNYKENGSNKTNDFKKDGNIIGFEYCLTNKSPLILSDIDDSSTLNYIKGSNILAALVKEYLKEGNSADSSEFKELFLDGKVRYCNAYKAEKGKGTLYRSTPAYLNINKLKKTKKLVDLSCPYNEAKVSADYNMSNGNQAKKLRNKNLMCVDGKYKVVEAWTEVIYHHSHSGINAKGQNGLLYYLEALEKGQCFKGYVYGPYEELIKTKKLLENANLSFGKSKNTQYGQCELLNSSIKPIYAKKLRFNKGDTIQVKLLSDAMLMDENGSYVTMSDKVKKIVAKQLGIIEDEDVNTKSFLKTSVITGYLGVWNMQKAQVPAIAAGSVLTYKLKECLEINELFIGERNIDGYGEVLIEKANNSFELAEYHDDYKLSVTPIAKTKKILKNVLSNNIYLDLVKKNQNDNRIQVGSATIGRFTLMLLESVNESSNKSDALDKLNERIGSIKNNVKKNEINRFICGVFGLKNDNLSKKSIIKGMTENSEHFDVFAKLVEVKEAEKIVFEMWTGVLLEALTYQKYCKKGINEDAKNILSN